MNLHEIFLHKAVEILFIDKNGNSYFPDSQFDTGGYRFPPPPPPPTVKDKKEN